MERRLIIMRHAQASQAEPDQGDHERPLTSKGHKEATEIAERLIELGWAPTQVVGSDANRTRQTWEAMTPSFDPTPPARWTKDLYLAGVDAVIETVSKIDDDVADVLLLGHNPGLQAVIAYLSGQRERLTTANAALLHTTGETWAETTGSQRFELVQLLRPRSL